MSGGPWSMPLMKAGARTAPVLAIRNQGGRGLRHWSLTPIRSRLPLRRPSSYRGPGPIRHSGSVRCPPRSKGLTSSGSDRPSALPANLGRAGPFRSTGSLPIQIPSGFHRRFHPAGWGQPPPERLARAPLLRLPHTSFRWAIRVDPDIAPA